MRTRKEFLAQECDNLEVVLNETLRFKYGLRGSGEFFEECTVRLTFLKAELAAANEADTDGLQRISIFLNQLSGLVSRIERSSLGQYSWPFVEELERIGTAICTEATLTNPNTPPQFYVLAGGGLDSYAIEPEQNRPSGGNRRIHTIVFPRTVKHFVLLHSILGHEIGHAMWRCSKHQNALRQILAANLFATGVFSSPAATANRLYSADAPPQVRNQLAAVGIAGVNAANFFGTRADWLAWTEEVLCDFIGLLTFGPTFIAAETNLLYSLDLSGSSLGPMHPPVGWRINYLLAAARLRGFVTPNYASEPLRRAIGLLWSTLETKRKTDPWFDVFTDQQIENTVNAMAALLQPLQPSLYVSPDERELELLVGQLIRRVPPVGYQLRADHSVDLRRIDFRHILYAGWIISVDPPSISFSQVNRLCEHGIMQQRAIDMQLAPP